MSPLRLKGIRACVFDAYGTLFDVNSAAAKAKDLLGYRWRPLAELWRAKQLQYTWLRSLTGCHTDFWQLTGDALDFAMASLEIFEPPIRERLMQLYLALEPYPDVHETLIRLKSRGIRPAILSNGSPTMLSAAVTKAGIADLLDAVLSVEEVRIYKPHPSVYQLAVDRFHAMPHEICFVSSNGWDAFSAKAFGFSVVWCNRAGEAPDLIPACPDREICALTALPDIVSA